MANFSLENFLNQFYYRDMEEMQITLIKKTIKDFFPDSEIMLFGSRARKESNAKSDYDILIKISETLSIREKVTLSEKIRKVLAQSKIDSDIIIKTEAELQKQSKLHGHLIRTIMNELIPV